MLEKSLPQKYRRFKRALMTKRSTTGLGLFTKERIKKGEFIIEYTGKILTAKEADKRSGKYLFETSENRFIDGSDRSNIARYINHSCSPNCVIEIFRGRIYVFSKRTIEPGEELNYDYDKEYFDEHIKPYGCKCMKCAKKA